MDDGAYEYVFDDGRGRFRVVNGQERNKRSDLSNALAGFLIFTIFLVSSVTIISSAVDIYAYYFGDTELSEHV